MKSYLVLSYDKNDVEGKEPRILYTGADQTLATRLVKEYQIAYKGYHIALAEVELPAA